jgi:hypothetical protein
MEHKYNQLSIERYSTNLAKHLCDRYFASNQAINGQQLITFSPVKQINLFVIQELLLRWNQEMAHLKSPYFDFENQEVKEALVQFMNVLSRKILVQRPHFEPLLSKVIADTLLWVLDPARIFNEKFLQVQDEISAPKLQAHLKYIDINKEYVKGFLAGLAPGVLAHGDVRNQFKTYLQSNAPAPQALDHLLAQLQELLPINKSELLPPPAAAFVPEPEASVWGEPTPEPVWKEPAPEPVATPKVVVAEPVVAPAPAAGQPLATAPPPVTPAPVREPEPAPTPAPAPVAMQPLATAPPPVTQPVSKPETQLPASETNLNERFKVEKATLNDRLARQVAPTLAASQMEKKIESLKDSISINQRFGFINELFNGENLEYYQAIQTLDSFDNADTAKDFVTRDLASRYNWSKKEEHVNKLLRLIERKFA